MHGFRSAEKIYWECWLTIVTPSTSTHTSDAVQRVPDTVFRGVSPFRLGINDCRAR